MMVARYGNWKRWGDWSQNQIDRVSGFLLVPEGARGKPATQAATNFSSSIQCLVSINWPSGSTGKKPKPIARWLGLGVTHALAIDRMAEQSI